MWPVGILGHKWLDKVTSLHICEAHKESRSHSEPSARHPPFPTPLIDRSVQATGEVGKEAPSGGCLEFPRVESQIIGGGSNCPIRSLYSANLMKFPCWVF